MKIAIVGATGVFRARADPSVVAKHEVRALARKPELDSCAVRHSGRSAGMRSARGGYCREAACLLAGCDVGDPRRDRYPLDCGDEQRPAHGMLTPACGSKARRICWQRRFRSARKSISSRASLSPIPTAATSGLAKMSPFRTLDDNGKPVNVAVIDMERQVRAVPTDQLRWCILRGRRVRRQRHISGGYDCADCAPEQKRSPARASRIWPLIHFEDMASAVVAAVERAPAGSTFNIVDKPIRQRDYLDRLAAAVGAPQPARDPDAPCPISQRCANQAAQNALGWHRRMG